MFVITSRLLINFYFRITVTAPDQTTVSPIISVPNDVRNDVPLKQPKRYTSQQQSKELESLPTPPNSEPLTQDSNTKIWPPPPKLRSATSMVNLTDLDSVETNNNSVDNTVEQRTKKPKWYKKLSNTLNISPHSLKLSGSDSNLSKEKSKSKKNIWRRMKIAS